jgi:hypothetical protein
MVPLYAHTFVCGLPALNNEAREDAAVSRISAAVPARADLAPNDAAIDAPAPAKSRLRRDTPAFTETVNVFLSDRHTNGALRPWIGGRSDQGRISREGQT